MLEGFKHTAPTYKGDVWVMAEHGDVEPNTATFELIGKARELADSLDVKVGVVLVGHKVEAMSKSLIAAGADNVYLVEHPLLAEFDPCAYRKAVADVIGKYWPQIVLFGATPQGRVLAPMISYRLGCGLTADCTSLDIKDSSRKGEIGVLMQTRPALGGNVMATICTKDSKSQMATARPGVMKKLEPDASRKGNIIKHSVALSDEDVSLEIIKTEMGHGSVNLGHADVIVSGGKGMQKPRQLGAACLRRWRMRCRKSWACRLNEAHRERRSSRDLPSVFGRSARRARRLVRSCMSRWAFQARFST